MRLIETTRDSWDSERLLDTQETQRDQWRLMISEQMLESHETNGHSSDSEKLMETNGDTWESEREKWGIIRLRETKWRPMGTHETQRDYWRHHETQRDYWILMRLKYSETQRIGNSWEPETMVDSWDQWRLMRLRETTGDTWDSERLLDTHETQRD